MDEYQTLIQTIGLTAGAAWASGINLYAVILVLGLGGATNAIGLPAELEVVQHPLVIGAAAVMYFVEFFADKIPGLDSGWDALHTFVRIPAGAMLAAGAVGDVSAAWQVTAGLLGGTLTATTHATKAGTRALVNTSPEPFTNWAASVTEDVAVFAGLWAALAHPAAFLVLLVLFLALAIWLLPKLIRGVARMLRTIGGWLGLTNPPEPEPALAVAGGPGGAVVPPPAAVPERNPAPAPSADVLADLERLQALRSAGTLDEAEFAAEKARILARGG